MRSLGLDIGDRRTGVAISDPQGILATPLTVLSTRDEDASIDEILKLVEQYKAERIVVGLPRRLNGEIGKQAGKVIAFADKLSRRAKQSNLNQLDVQLWDERLSTKVAERLKMGLGEQRSKSRSTATCPPGLGRQERRGRNRNFPLKAKVDAIAAAIILQDFLDSHRQRSDEGT